MKTHKNMFYHSSVFTFEQTDGQLCNENKKYSCAAFCFGFTERKVER